jgi:alkanesulfonate monooxygenase SsuD/methylene tetrahydromethanopterin reductase-like flavin-dependent oxidoreductase (luciferase family)
VSFAGRFTQFTDVVAEPRPVQPAARRSGSAGGPTPRSGGAARVGDGWIAYLVTPERFRTSIEKIQTFAREIGRPLDPERASSPPTPCFTVVDDDRSGAGATARATSRPSTTSRSTTWRGSTACSDRPRPARSGLPSSSRPASGPS